MKRKVIIKKCPGCGTTSKKKFRVNKDIIACSCGYKWIRRLKENV